MDKEQHRKDKGKYWYGGKNKAIRYYFYVQQGLALLNEFRYLIMSVLAIYALLKLDNPWLMPLMFFLALPILAIVGYISVHHVQKVMEWLNIEYTTHFNRYNITLQEKQKVLLVQLRTVLYKILSTLNRKKDEQENRLPNR